MVDTYSPLYLQSHGNQVKSLVTGKNGNIAPIFKKSRKEEGIESSPADRVLSGLLDEMLTMREQWVLGSPEYQLYPGLHKKQYGQGGISGLLFLSGETPALRSPSQEGDRRIEAGSEESPRDDQKASFL